MRYQLTPDKYLLDSELTQLRENLKSLSLRDRAYFLTLIETGMRASECLNLEPSALIGANRLHVKTLKNGVDRIVTISDDLYDILTTLSRNGRPFPIKLRNMDAIWRKVRPVNKRLHSLRHTFGRNLYKQSRDIRTVMYALGHTSIMNTIIYVSVDAEQDLAAAMLKMRGA